MRSCSGSDTGIDPRVIVPVLLLRNWRLSKERGRVKNSFRQQLHLLRIVLLVSCAITLGSTKKFLQNVVCSVFPHENSIS